MKLSQSDHDSILSVSSDAAAEAGPSSSGYDGVVASAKNGHHTNGHTFPSLINGSPGMAGGMQQKRGKSIAKVNLPGSALYEDSFIDREEFVRLVIQSLRDVGYIESAATLEAESGYILEAPEVTQFRQYILDGMWLKAEQALNHLGIEDEESVWDAKFLINEQKYLELLEAKKTTTALQVLRNELAPLNIDSDHLHTLSSLIMCSEPEDLRRRANWDGASGTSRQQLLNNLHNYVPSSVMIPQRRFSTLLQQARIYQRHRCLYHNSPSDVTMFSLYSDHQCNNRDFPNVTTTILDIHTDEVWNMEWSHDGLYLATAGKDKKAIIWRMGSTLETGSSSQDWAPQVVLGDHPFPVGSLSWSMDDTILLTSSENIIKMWNAKTGVCIRTLEAHSETVAALAWLPDGSGFISGGLDRKIIHWDADGKLREEWSPAAIRITDLCITPDFTRLVAVGMEHTTTPPPSVDTSQQRAASIGDITTGVNVGTPSSSSKGGNRMIVFDLSTKETLLSIRMEGELTSVKISHNSQFALINHSPDVIYLYDIRSGRLTGKFIGQQQGRHIIRSCFGGVNGTFVVSGSEDGNVYVWHRETGTLLEVLSGHGEGSVNSVAWHPRNDRMFASCSDDHTVRIWEAPPPERPSMMQIPHRHETTTISNGKGKGKVRQQQRWEGEDNGQVDL